MNALLWTVGSAIAAITAWIMAYLGLPLWVWTIYSALILVALHSPLWVGAITILIALILNLSPLRRWLISDRLFQYIQAAHLLPNISDTEKAAIEAGNVWVEREFFSGRPDFSRLLAEPYPTLTEEQQAFLDGPVEKICAMATDWEIFQRKDLPPQLWNFLKQSRIFGMMIPQEYGGLGFSNAAYSAVMTKLASRSFTHTATVGVTNSLGPAKLLLHYGTPAQKQYYLPRLASGEEIPCFALTEPNAGSDAASITSSGVVFAKGGEKYIRLNWQKRYTTLGAISTLIGLAVQLYDPENLLEKDKHKKEKGNNVGITCVLVPTNTPGVIVGRRHDPMGVPFYNSPMAGENVELPISCIIGGEAQAGQGWKMLMQSLSAGRGVSFPATCTGVAKLTTRVTSAYSRIRHQFGLPIGRFEGVEEPLARIAGLTYLMEAARRYTCGGVDQGEQSGVVSAIAKYQFTELSRKIITDGMDILGGAGISRGPRNLLANIYTATPIPITVEGANILTRALIIYGQGAIRSHPYVYDEILALQQGDLRGFDRTLWAHLGFSMRNLVRAGTLSLTRGAWVKVPPPQTMAKATARYGQKLVWASAWFACLSDYAMLRYGGSLKRHENVTGRFADVLSWLYLASATLQRFEKDGRPEADLPYVHWAMTWAIAKLQQDLSGLLDNLPIPIIGPLLRASFRLNALGAAPSDHLTQQVAQLMQQPDSREHLTAGIYLPQATKQALGRLENAYRLTLQAEPIFKRLKAAVKSGQLSEQMPLAKTVASPTAAPLAAQSVITQAAIAQSVITQAVAAPSVVPQSAEALIEAGLRAGLISGLESDVAYAAQRAREDAIQVDSFSLEEYQNIGHFSGELTSDLTSNLSSYPTGDPTDNPTGDPTGLTLPK
jgi:acyl-CoA dehydrogenase